MRSIIRKPEVLKRTGLSDTTIWRLERADDFPARVQLTEGGSVGWVESEVERWVHARVRGAGKRPPRALEPSPTPSPTPSPPPRIATAPETPPLTATEPVSPALGDQIDAKPNGGCRSRRIYRTRASGAVEAARPRLHPKRVR